MKLEPGMRVRCVDAYPNRHIFVGGNYRVAEIDGGMVKVENLANWYADYRFKPVIRVKAPSAPPCPLIQPSRATSAATMRPGSSSTW